MKKSFEKNVGTPRGVTSAKKKEGPRVESVSSWDEAMAKLTERKADLCVLDVSGKSVQLPHRDQEQGSVSSRIILLCDAFDHDARQWLHRVLPGAMLLKPVSDEQLTVVAERLVATVRQNSPSTSPSMRFVTQAIRMAETLLSDAAHGFIVSDPEGRTIYANKALAEMLGSRQEEIIGKTPEDLLDPESMQRFRQEYHARRRGKGSSIYQVRLKTHGGRALPVVVTGLGIYSDTGKFLGSLGRIVRMMSSLPVQEQKLPQKSQQIKRSLRLLVDSLIPSLLGMKSLERLKAILDFMETFLQEDGGEAGWWQMALQRENLLTPTEIALCAMIRSGLSSDQMAEIFGVSRKTIAFHRGKVRRKLGVTGREERLATFLKTYSSQHIAAGALESRPNIRLMNTPPLNSSDKKNPKRSGKSSV